MAVNLLRMETYNSTTCLSIPSAHIIYKIFSLNTKYAFERHKTK